MTRAEKLIEGFKLGSLGARTHFVDPQQKDFEDPNKSVKRTKTRIVYTNHGKQKSPLAEFSDPPYFYWMENDDWAYALEVYVAEDGEFGLFFSGGKDLTLINGVFTPDDYQVSGGDWVMRAASGLLSRYEDYLNLFKKLVPIAEDRGSAGVIKSSLYSSARFEPNVSVSKKPFAKWLKQKKSQEL
jgi:hypothetical protein